MLKTKTMNKCECGKLWEDDELKHEVIHDVFATGDYWNTEIAVSCPACHSDYIEEVVMCHTCGEFETLDGFDDCQTCVAEMEAQENANL